MNSLEQFFQSALGWDHQTELSKHSSQKDAAKGFGGKFGVDKAKQDKVNIIHDVLSVLSGNLLQWVHS